MFQFSSYSIARQHLTVDLPLFLETLLLLCFHNTTPAIFLPSLCLHSYSLFLLTPLLDSQVLEAIYSFYSSLSAFLSLLFLFSFSLSLLELLSGFGDKWDILFIVQRPLDISYIIRLPSPGEIRMFLIIQNPELLLNHFQAYAVT